MSVRPKSPGSLPSFLKLRMPLSLALALFLIASAVFALTSSKGRTTFMSRRSSLPSEDPRSFFNTDLSSTQLGKSALSTVGSGASTDTQGRPGGRHLGEVPPVFMSKGQGEGGLLSAATVGMNSAGDTQSLDSSAESAECQGKLMAARQEISLLRGSSGSSTSSRQLLQDSLVTPLALGVPVKTGNRDLLQMDVKALVQQIEKLRAENARLKSLSVETGQVSDSSSKQTGQPSAATSAQGYSSCSATPEEMLSYLQYTPGAPCPDDWPLAQRLIFERGCLALPRRRCRAVTLQNTTEPLPLPQSLFSQSALTDSSLLWSHHQCRSFECLNSRPRGECRQCFNLTLEERRWQTAYRGTLPMADVVKMKRGTLRIGLDAGGGTGTFAAHMARLGVTVMTSAVNKEPTVKEGEGEAQGLPYMETIAARGLIPLHLPHQSRLPFFDGVLDVVHSSNSITSLSLEQFGDLIYEWDRVLRVGGILWLEVFHKSKKNMPAFLSVLESLGYKRLYWKELEVEERGTQQVYLTCVIEKQAVAAKGTPKPRDSDTAQSA